MRLHMRLPCRRKTYRPIQRGPPKKAKETSYWDKATWEMSTPSFIPDKWYLRVAWTVVILGTCIYLNIRLTAPS